MLLIWLQRGHVKEWWDDGDDTLEKVATHYSRDAENTRRYLASLNGEPIGYFQYHRFSEDHVGTVQFLAEENMLSQGLRTKCLLAFIETIQRLERPSFISVDPHPENGRAIRCYEKCGFAFDSEPSGATTCLMIRTERG